ncbi:hypothetical protein [Tomitella gaofuii]|uniref:hypothetical protein n=1 Tax=Tomitella gaofuii TaxID=2760083 RepID=UPI0015FD0A75|nr:hypothetical protein [Tomitella gaofuii]
MQAIDCSQCGTTVLAEKYSDEHTSIQWLGDAHDACPLMRAGEVRPTGAAAGAAGSVCPALHSTIDQAARDGLIGFSMRSEPVPGVLR